MQKTISNLQESESARKLTDLATSSKNATSRAASRTSRRSQKPQANNAVVLANFSERGRARKSNPISRKLWNRQSAHKSCRNPREMMDTIIRPSQLAKTCAAMSKPTRLPSPSKYECNNPPISPKSLNSMNKALKSLRTMLHLEYRSHLHRIRLILKQVSKVLQWHHHSFRDRRTFRSWICPYLLTSPLPIRYCL